MELLSRSQCKNTEQMVGRNLGTTSDMAEDPGRTYEFFRAVKEPQQGRLKWSTIRCSWIKKSTEAKIRKFSSTVEKQPLPKSVWQQRGWQESVIDKWSDHQGTFVHEP